jgi:uncharacterized protein YbjQ (UPF0145 family)
MELLLSILVQLLPILGPLLVFYAIGAVVEKRHYRKIRSRETKQLNLLVLTLSKIKSNLRIDRVEMVQGSCVISLDYFKRVLASLRMIVGGRVRSYESLLDRARREAILRMKESCQGADLILNLRLENTAVGKSANKKGQIGAIEVLAYGTAVYYQQDSSSALLP